MYYSQVLIQVGLTAEDPDRTRNKMRRNAMSLVFFTGTKNVFYLYISTILIAAFFGSKEIWQYICIDCFTHCNVSSAVKSRLKMNMAESSGDICPPFLSAMKAIIDKIHTQQIKPILYQLFPFSRYLYILKQQLNA